MREVNKLALPNFTTTLDATQPTGGEYVHQIDDIIRTLKSQINSCFSDISGYPYNTYLIMYKWTTSNRPNSNRKTGMMGYNQTIKKFEMWNGSSWVPLEYDAYTCTRKNGDNNSGIASKALEATNAINDKDGHDITTTYLKANQVQTYETNKDKNKIVKFTSTGRIQFPSGAQFWVT